MCAQWTKAYDLKEMALLKFQHPFGAIVSGPTKAGKTEWVKNLIRHAQEMIDPLPEKIWWCYSQWQPSYTDLCGLVTFVEGIPDISTIGNGKPQLLVLDDLMQEMKKKKKTLDELFTKGCHHSSISCIQIAESVL